MPRYSRGITGYALKRLDEVALVQHYLEVSPMLDLTGTPEVALYFALLGSEGRVGPQVIYAFDPEDLRGRGLEVTDHNFLLLPLGEGGHKCRWVKQDGYGVCRPDLSQFDLLDFPHEEFHFLADSTDRAAVKCLGDLLKIDDDSVVLQVFSFFHLLANELGYSGILSGELHRYGILHPKERIKIELNALKELAVKYRLHEQEAEIANLIGINEQGPGKHHVM
ncbi:FRG domain-containing protein [Rufibacter psychrotolerans]|uniref:FRG domain-containing protein n=1 Tax=Rufibacter psychrotolerans TaxID=2812556 RepID=UPI001967FE06|nr:FRG domain-containing protein [Rufibacter sp. SYSU D00308]